ncbi:MAG: phosphatase PAP2 family protein [Chloroflexota bacterium]|nr:phosphatase PAP2 family protein [Chloroflexota bacterium]
MERARQAGAQPLAQAWKPAGRAELIGLGAYFLLVVSLADILNVRLGVELMTLVVAVAALAITRRVHRFIRDWWLYLLGLLMWNLSGPIAAASPFPLHMDFMLNLDNAIFLGHQPVVMVQQALAPASGVNGWDVLNALIYNLHVPEPYIAGYFLWRLNRAVYFQFAASLLILLVLGFLTFIVFPAVPPWMAAQRFNALPEVVNRFGLVVRAHPLPFHGTPIFYLFRLRGDAVAAFPSEHAAVPLLDLLAFWRVLGRRAWPLVLWVAAVLFSILYLGEHWVTDALAGWLYVLVIFTAVRQHVTRHRQRSGDRERQAR